MTTVPAETVPRAEQPDLVSEVQIREKIVDSPSAGAVSDTRRERSALHLNYPTFETFAPVSQANHSAVDVEDKKRIVHTLHLKIVTLRLHRKRYSVYEVVFRSPQKWIRPVLKKFWAMTEISRFLKRL